MSQSGNGRVPVIGPPRFLQPDPALADTSPMSMIGDIAGFSTALSTAQVQSAVATKVLKLATQQEGQVASQLLESAMENLQAIITQFAGDIGNTIDVEA